MKLPGAAAAVCLLLLAVLAASAGDGVPVGGRYAVVYYGESDAQVYRLVLERGYRVVIAQPYFKVPREWRERGVEVYVYLNVLGMHVSMLEWVKREHPDWLLYNRDGEPAKYWYGRAFMCNIAVKGYQDYLISKAKEYLRKGFTGVFLDDVHLDIASVGGPQYDTPVYDEAEYGSWRRALLSFVARLKNETGARIIYNAGWSRPDPELMELVDGVLLEAHPTTYVVTGSWESVEKPRYESRPWSVIYANSLAAQSYAKAGKIVVALSYGESLEVLEYSYAAVRLFDFYFWASTPIIDRILDSKVLKLNLGDPLGDHRVEKGVYFRLYERGLVAVNPSSKVARVAVEVPGEWRRLTRLDGSVYEAEGGRLELLLKPGEGVVLLASSEALLGGESGHPLREALPYLLAACLVALLLAWKTLKGRLKL